MFTAVIVLYCDILLFYYFDPAVYQLILSLSLYLM